MVFWALAAASIWAAYWIGRREGVRDANHQAVVPGSWVVFVKDASCEGHKNRTIPSGVQAVVTGVDKWDRLSLWIAEPWAESWGEVPKVYQVTDWSSFRAKPMHTVPKESLDPTLSALEAWETKVEDMTERLFPPGFFEIQRRLNR